LNPTGPTGSGGSHSEVEAGDSAEEEDPIEEPENPGGAGELPDEPAGSPDDPENPEEEPESPGEEPESPAGESETPASESEEPTAYTPEAPAEQEPSQGEGTVNITILPTGTKVRFTSGTETKECIGGGTCQLTLGKTYSYSAGKDWFITETGNITASETAAVCLVPDWAPYEEADFKTLGKVKGGCTNGKGNEIYNLLNDIFNTGVAEEGGNIWD